MSTAGNLRLELSDRVVHDRAIETLRATLDKDELLRNWQAGEELTPDETVAEAEATGHSRSPRSLTELTRIRSGDYPLGYN